MKQLLYATLLLAVACKQQSNKGFEVEGTIKNNSNAKVIYLEETSFGNMQPVIVDSAQLDKNGSYQLSTKAKEETIYNLRLDQTMYPFASFINDEEDITINADFNSKEVYTVKGSPASIALKEYLNTTGAKLKSLYNNGRLIDSLQTRQINDSLLNQQMAEHSNGVSELKAYTTNFINKSTSPALTLFALGSYQSIAGNPAFQLQGYTQQEVMEFFNKLTTKFPENKTVASLKTDLQQQQQQSAAGTGSLLNKPAPDFTLPDVNGKPVSLSSYKGKYVLVDFWASWCPPCRAENPNVVKAYNQFKDKNFTVLGVSLDRPGGKDAWVKAIKDDQLAWTQVSDLKFWDSPVVSLYGFDGIPYNVLVDPNGVVIGESLRGEELENKLKSVLK